MEPAICARCKKNVAVVFITKLENGQSKTEGLCLKCAKEIKLKPVDDMIQKMGLTDEELETFNDDMTTVLSAEGMEALAAPPTDEEMEDAGKTATFPFLNRLFGLNNHSAGSEQRGGELTPQDGTQHRSGDDQRQQRTNDKGGRGAKKKFLDAYCINLTDRARDGKLDAMIGRDEELERVIQILNRRQKNNPCLLGEPGVGKTAIAEGLAQHIVNGDVPYKLRDKEVYLLDLTSLVAGTQFRGQFESRMKGLIQEITREGNVILVIDEIHSIVGAGDAEGSMNAANILKPALSRGEIQVIGATTFNEYRKHIEKDAALERRFQPVTVAEPSIDDSIKILSGVAHYYETYHGVTIPPRMCRLAVTLSERYITDRYLPDKAIDLIDEACSDVNLRNPDIARLDMLQKELADVNKEREMLIADTNEEHFERLAYLRSECIRLEDEILQLQTKGKPELTQDNLARIIELWTKIPAANIKADEYERLSTLGERLREHIIGQDEAIGLVCAAIKRSRVGMQAKRKPASFIFVGSTGVGKTELVKRLADELFDSPENLVRLDMSEFMEKHSVSRIIGSPPGYVGYDEAGQLTEKIRRKPYSVILFDEIEKAHPDVMNVLLQILDDGRITDAQGRTVNFENTVIIMTTNAGSNTKGGSLGFGQTVAEQTRDKAMKALNEFLRPEFINRVDEIVCFNRLTEENFKAIARLMLDELKQVMWEKGYDLDYDDSLVSYLAEKSYSPTYGARNLRRQIQKEVEDAVAAEIVDHLRGRLTALHVTVTESKVTVQAE
ncbi:MAG: ATP-dependent Clp protease ATP-binding subunit [Oscillospiraceae bacterium]|nr:ATP-dependent Clp protease ATP-binding subunit [Oscillospiraceae bacterium]